MNYFKFNPSSHQTLEALKESQLYFSDPDNFNDPLDAKANLIEVSFNSKDDFRKLIERSRSKIGDVEYNNTLSSDQDVLKSQVIEMYQGLIVERVNKMGVCCFSKNLYNNVMWNFYADHHMGFVMEFYPEIMDNKPFHITYTNSFPTINALEIGTLRTEVILSKIYGFKSIEWQHEQEVRLITDGKDILKQFNPKYLKNIYLGFKSSDMTIQAIDNILKATKYGNVNLFRMKIRKNSYQLDTDPIKLN
jgi:hypothetical protein